MSHLKGSDVSALITPLIALLWFAAFSTFVAIISYPQAVLRLDYRFGIAPIGKNIGSGSGRLSSAPSTTSKGSKPNGS